MKPVVLLCGLWPYAARQAARELAGPGARVIRYETARPGLLTRDGATPVPAGEDPPAALVSDLLRTPAGPAAGLVVLTPEGCEPDLLRTAWRDHAGDRPLHVVTVVPADQLLTGLTDETTLAAAGLHHGPADTRSIGELVGRQLEQADTVLLTGRPEGDDEWEAEQLRVLLRRLAPWSRHRSGTGWPEPGRREPLDPITRGLRGRPVGMHEPVPEHGVTASVFRARRPFHPGRLHDALDEITAGVLRSRGHFWHAGRPDLVLSWESAGGLTLGPVSGWLADLPGEHWAAAHPERRLAAEIDWNPYFGDRHHQLAFTGIDLDPQRLHETLNRCLLTDEELARGERWWRRLPDPFARAYPVPVGAGPES